MSLERKLEHIHVSKFLISNLAIFYLKDCFCTLFFRPRTRPRTSLQCFALDSRCSEAKHCRDVLGRVLG